jgi:WD40 repeat protein
MNGHSANVSVALDANRPWPGLQAFAESSSDYFFGRSEEADELFRCVRREPVTLLFGQSGLGKTSLLHAALLPRVRSIGLVPIVLRLDFSPGSPLPLYQLSAAIEQTLTQLSIDLGATKPSDGLWEFFHRVQADGETPLPNLMLIFDQFEEVFTLGLARDNSRVATQTFLSLLADLIENRIPQDVEAQLDADPDLVERFVFDRQSYRILISLREDYLASLDSVRKRARSLGRNSFHLGRMRGSAAVQAVLGPGRALVSQDTAHEIVRIIGARSVDDPFGADTSSGNDLESLDVEPSLLSLFCQQLNERRIGQNLPEITPELVIGNRDNILEEFYVSALSDQPPRLCDFVEDELLDRSGFRQSLVIKDAREKLEKRGVPGDKIDLLVSRRLLRFEDRLNIRRVEIIHDVLSRIIVRSRDLRYERREKEQAEERQRELQVRYRKLQMQRLSAVAAAVVFFGVIVWGMFQYFVAKEAQKAAEESRYATDVRLSQFAVDEGNFGRARDLLKRYIPQAGEPDIRGFEWRYLWGQLSGGSLMTFRGHAGEVRSVAFSPDGTLLATGGVDGSVWVSDLTSAHGTNPLDIKTRRLDIEGPGVMATAFSPDGKILAVASGNWRTAGTAGKIYLFDVPTFSLRETLVGHSKAVNSVAFSLDGNFLATGSEDDRAMVWDLRAGPNQQPHVLPGHTTGINAVVFVPGTQLLAVGSGDGYLQIWDFANNRSVVDQVVDISGIMSLAPSRDGRKLAVGTRDGPVLFFDLSTRAVTKDRIVTKQGLIYALAFSPDGSILATGGSNCTVKLWSTEKFDELALLRGHQDIVFAVAFSPSGEQLASGSADATVKLWSSHPPAPKERIRFDGAVAGLAFSPDGRFLGVAEGEGGAQVGAAVLWDVEHHTKWAEFSGHRGPLTAVAISPSGKQMGTASSDHTGILWDIAARRPRVVLDKDKDEVTSIAFSPDGKLLATGSRENVIRLWSTDSGTLEATLSGHEGWVRSIAFSPDGKLLASSSSDRTAALWDVRTRTRLFSLLGYQGAVNGVAFSPDGKLLATGCNDRTIRIWDVARRKFLPNEATVLQGQNAAVLDVLFSPDGRTLVGTGQDSTVAMWNMRTHLEVALFTPHDGGVLAAAFSPDGNVLATGGNDHELFLFRAPTILEIAQTQDVRQGWSTP